MNRSLVSSGLASGLLLLAACSGNNGGGLLGPGGDGCVTGTTQACVCAAADGVEEGTQVCALGSFQSCVCVPGKGDGGGGKADGGRAHRDGGGPLVEAGADAPGHHHHDGGTGDASPGEAGAGEGGDATVCVPTDAGPVGPGPVARVCVIYPAGADDENECDGHHDLEGFAPNGLSGNGFDDNCNGLVDEGCACDTVGATKPCFLVPASQTLDGQPVGWCATNSAGTVECAQPGTGAPVWSGECRGAIAPSATDVCAGGDFDCDGKNANPPGVSCSCNPAPVACPTETVTTVPYPTPGSLPVYVDGAAWFSDPTALGRATGWTWTLSGGDCDNILPHPTFGMYATPDGTGAPLGTQVDTFGVTGQAHALTVASPAIGSVVYPAFTLSGDYVLDSAFRLDGQSYTCSVKIDVAAPGLRTEGCWDTVATGDDLDLHLAKVDFPACAGTESWSDQSTNATCAAANEDCYYGDCASGSAIPATADWGYASSPVAACSGWGSQPDVGATACFNPRLDRDANGLSGACSSTITNPNDNGALTGFPFCGPENLNVDDPADGDVFALAMRFYNKLGTAVVHPHVNVYCDGVRVLATGYDAWSGTVYPQLSTSGADTTGDMWKVALVTTHVSNGATTCDVAPTRPTTADAVRDGTTSFCVDNDVTDGANSQVLLTSTGAAPTASGQLCFH